MKTTLEVLQDWVKLNNPAKLATMLGYRSSNTIHQWIKRGRIPPHQDARVRELLEKNKKG